MMSACRLCLEKEPDLAHLAKSWHGICSSCYDELAAENQRLKQQVKDQRDAKSRRIQTIMHLHDEVARIREIWTCSSCNCINTPEHCGHCDTGRYETE